MFPASHARSLIDSQFDWWTLAGLETLTDEAPRDWLAAPAPVKTFEPADAVVARRPALPKASPAPRVTEAAPAVAPLPPLAPLAMPGDLAAFRQWLEHHPALPGTQWNSRRILPEGQAGAALMVLSLTPEMDDEAAGALYSGPAGKLLDAMLRAIGLTRENCYLASLTLTRPPGGWLDPADLAALAPMLWHHVGLVQPKRLLIFGSDLTRLMAGTDPAEARGRLLSVNHNGTNMDVVAIQHPALLLDRPVRKAAAWDSLKLLVQG